MRQHLSYTVFVHYTFGYFILHQIFAVICKHRFFVTGGRKDVRQVAVLVVTSKDAPSFDGTPPELSTVIVPARVRGVQVVVVAVPPKPGDVQTLTEIENGLGPRFPSSNLVKVPGSFVELVNKVTEIQDLICVGRSMVSARNAILFELHNCMRDSVNAFIINVYQTKYLTALAKYQLFQPQNDC